MPPDGEEVADSVVDREELLSLRDRFEAPHMCLTAARGLVRDFGAVVGVAGGVVDDGRHDDAVRGTVTAEAISDEATRYPASRVEQFAQEPRCGMAIAAGLQQDVDNVTVLVDGSPEILTPAANRHEQLVQMPRIADGARPTSEPTRVGEAEGGTPVAHGFVRDRDAALREEIFDLAEAQVKVKR